MSKYANLSIVVSAYSCNRYYDMIDLLKGLENQSYKDSELIIVIDENIKLYNEINKYIENSVLLNAKCIFNPKNRGLSYSRNLGIEHSMGTIIAFIDDDAIPHPRWAESIINTFEDNEVGAIAGDIIPIWEHNKLAWFPQELYWMISCSYVLTPKKKAEVNRGFGTNMAFRRSLFDKIGLFDTNLGINGRNWLGGEDSDMFLRIKESGKKIIFDPEIIVWHKVYAYRLALKNIAKRAYDGGASIAVLNKRQQYELKDSIESSYLTEVIFHFYPHSLKRFFRNPSIILMKQMIIVALVIILEGLGYLIFRIKLIGRVDQDSNRT